jgi:hypothetical protein
MKIYIAFMYILLSSMENKANAHNRQKAANGLDIVYFICSLNSKFCIIIAVFSNNNVGTRHIAYNVTNIVCLPQNSL